MWIRSLGLIGLAFLMVGCVEEAPVAPPPQSVADRPMPDLSAMPRASRTPAHRQVAPPSSRRELHVIRTCRAPNGALAYQDGPCAVGSTEIAQRVVAGDAPGAARRSQRIQADAVAEARRVAEIAYGRGSGTRQVAASSRSSADERCERARVRAQEQRDRHRGLPDIDWLRRLDEWVRSECADTHSWTRSNTMPKR